MTRLIVKDEGGQVIVRSPGPQGVQGPTGDVPGDRAIIAGTGLTGGGDLSEDRTLAIASGGVGTTQLADEAVNGAKLGPGSVTAGKLGEASVATAKIVDGAVTSDKIADATIVDADVSASAGIDPAKIDGTAVVEARQIVPGTGLTGGGDLAADRSLGVVFGASAGTVAEGDDARLSETVLVSSSSVTWSPAQPVLDMSGTATVTLPLAADNANRTATIVNTGYGTITVARSGSDLIGGSPTGFTIPGEGSVQLISNGAGWLVMQGRYVSKTVGKATYEWDFPGWRLMKYNSGVRDVAALLVNGWTAANAQLWREGNCRFAGAVRFVRRERNDRRGYQHTS